MKYDAAIILGHELENDKSLSEVTKRRTDLGIMFVKEGQAESLIMSGGHEDFGEKYGVSIADAMKQYALRKEISEYSIHTEDASSETVGQLVFCKQGVIDPMNFRKLVVLSHDYHLDRMKAIGKVVFDGDYDVDYLGLISTLNTSEMKKRQVESKRTFLETFGKLTPGDDKRFLETLLNEHEMYKSNPEFFREKLERLKSRY
jgi:uncharacterized SAM-binding protein YcdF (DUF218 family)